MTPEQRYRLISKFEVITSRVLSQDLCDLLYQDKLLNENDLQEIESEKTQNSKSRKLLRILLTKDHPSAYEFLLRALEKKGYPHIQQEIAEQSIPPNQQILNELYGNQSSYNMTIFEATKLFEDEKNLSEYQISARLHTLALTGDIERLKSILEFDRNLINLRTPTKRTLLHTAAEGEKSGELARFLLKNGLGVDLTDAQSQTALHVACANDNPNTTRILLEFGANTHARDQYKALPLHHCCFHDNHNCAEFLLAVGCDVNLADQYGDTALHHACVEDAAMCVELLISHGACMGLKNFKGETAFDGAVSEDCTRVLRFLKGQTDEKENMEIG